MIIAVDAAGGDYYPEHPVQGAVEAVNEKEGLSILLTGPRELIGKELAKHSYEPDRIRVLDAAEIIGMEDSPSSAVKNKRQSSIVMGLTAQKRGECQAFVSAGNTGALLAASVLILGKLPKVMRPTIATTFPTLRGTRLLLDAGANLELKPEIYFQIARMGTIYCRDILNVSDPSVGLINVGEEPEKGTDLLREVHKSLQKLPNFRGNVEGRDIFPGNADVFICDGLIGNILLKFGESIPATVQTLISGTMDSMQLDTESRELVERVIRQTLYSFNYEHVGGVPFLGVNGVSMVGHGGSSPRAVKNMILNAAHCVEAGVNDKIVASLT